MPGRGRNYQALDVRDAVVHGRNRHRTRTSVACSQVFALLHIVVGLVLPLAYAFQKFRQQNKRYGKDVQFWQLDAYHIYLYGLSIICVICMIAFGMLKTHDGKQSHQAASEFIKAGAVLFGVCGMLQAGFKFCSIVGDHSCENCGNHGVDASESFLSMLFIFILWLFVCAYSNRCITKWKRFARVAIMLLWATCMSSWSGLFVDEVMHDFEHGNFSYKICNLKKENVTPVMELVSSLGLFSEFPYVVSYHRNNEDSQEKMSYDDVKDETSAFLIPGAMEFYLIMSGFMYVMYGNIGRDTDNQAVRGTRHLTLDKSYFGLGLGIITIVCAILTVVAHVKSEKDMAELLVGKPSVIYFAFAIGVYAFAIAGNVVSHHIMRNSDVWVIDDRRDDEVRLTMVLMFISASGLFINSVFTIIAASLSMQSVHQPELVIAQDTIKIIDITCQMVFLYDAFHRTPPNEFKPTFARNITMFLIFSNFVFWAMNIYEQKDLGVYPMQYCFYSYEIWSIVLHLVTPLEIYFRFHSCLLYFEIWLSG
ncbi:proton channel OtopLc-like [Saccoglossus kowalevskii]